MGKNTKELTIEERKAILEELVNGEALKRDMVRKAKMYPTDYAGYLRTADVTDALKVGSDKEGGYLVPDEMENKIVKALENSDVVRMLAKVIKTENLLKIPGVTSHGTLLIISLTLFIIIFLKMITWIIHPFINFYLMLLPIWNHLFQVMAAFMYFMQIRKDLILEKHLQMLAFI